MTDVTEQFAEIMNKTIQEAVDADERADKAGVLLAEALAREEKRSAAAAEHKEMFDFLKEELRDLADENELCYGVAFDQRQEIKELAARMEELLMENMRLTVQAEAAEEELAELKDSEADSS